MIKKENLKKGMRVKYNSFSGKEFGRVKGWNDRGVWVVYDRKGRDMNLYENYFGALTNYEDLEKVESE